MATYNATVAGDIGRILERHRGGDESALSELVALLYPELHRIAGRHFQGERPEHTLQTTALVHEAFLKLAGDERRFEDETHFLAVASRVMRQVLVDYARARSTRKRAAPHNGESGLGSGRYTIAAGAAQADLLDLDQALSALAGESPDLAQLVEMHYFGGMTAEEIATALARSVHTVRHDLRLGQAWLRRALASS